MNQIGLSSEEIIELLTKHDIENGQKTDAEKLKAGIAQVVVENNARLFKEVPMLVAQRLEEFAEQATRKER